MDLLDQSGERGQILHVVERRARVENLSRWLLGKEPGDLDDSLVCTDPETSREGRLREERAEVVSGECLSDQPA